MPNLYNLPSSVEQSADSNPSPVDAEEATRRRLKALYDDVKDEHERRAGMSQAGGASGVAAQGTVSGKDVGVGSALRGDSSNMPERHEAAAPKIRLLKHSKKTKGMTMPSKAAKKKRTRTTPQTVNKVLDLCENGASVVAVGRELGLASATLYAVLNGNHGVMSRTQRERAEALRARKGGGGKSATKKLKGASPADESRRSSAATMAPSPHTPLSKKNNRADSIAMVYEARIADLENENRRLRGQLVALMLGQ